MYIESVPNRHSPPCLLLRESYRVDGKVKKRTLANLTSWPCKLVNQFNVLLKGGQALEGSLPESFEVTQSLPFGNVHAVLQTIENLNIPSMLTSEPGRERSLLVAMIASRILFPQSKLATARALDPQTAHCALGPELQLGKVNEDELYQALKSLLQRQHAVEQELAKQHLSEGSVVLYDLTSTYYEGKCCPIAKFGYNRDRKRGKRQINFGLLTNQEGIPIACEVYPGNTADPTTVSSQIKTLRERFNFKKMVLVGDRGMLTQTKIDEEIRPHGDLSWISALDSDGLRALVEAGTIEPELFDDFGLVEVQSPDYPEERLVVCYNPFLSAERSERRKQLLECTQRVLDSIVAAVGRQRNAYRGADKIGRRIQREAARYKMLKHFQLEIQNDQFSYTLKQEAVEAERRMDGLYVIRAGRIPLKEMDANQVVGTYKRLSTVEQAFRTLKLSGLKVRPIFHRLEETVRAHIFLCVLAYYVERDMKSKLAAMLFVEEDQEAAQAQRSNAVEPAKPSPVTLSKAATKTDKKDRPVFAFRDLLERLGTITKNRIQPRIPGVEAFTKITQPTSDQRRAFKLLGVKIAW